MTTTKHVSAQAHSAMFTSKQRTIALIVVAMAFIMDLLDSTIVNVAIPTIQQNLGTSYSTIQWLIAGYTLTFALLLITGGRMGDVFGYKKIFMIGVFGFTLASLLSGLAVNSSMLVAARLLQGSMAALMVPQVVSLMQVMYKPAERGAINGLFGALAGVAASLGPIIGGLLIKANIAGLSWRPLFLINIPVGIFSFIMAIKYLPDGKSDHPLKLDLVGTAIVIVAMSLLIYPLIQGREAGWPLWTYLMLIASLPVFYLFARWMRYKDRKDGSPLIVPSLFHSMSFRAGLTINLVFDAVIISYFLTTALILQIGLGYSAIHSALTSLPIAIGIGGTMGIFGEKIIPRLGRRAPMIGAVIVTIGLLITSAVFQHYGLGTHSWQLIIPQLITGLGMGFVFASLFAVVLADVEVKHAGAASGLLNAVQQVGGSIGVALIGLIFFGQISHASLTSFQAQEPHLRQQLTALHVPVVAQAAIVSGADTCFHDRSIEKDMTVVPKSCKQSGPDKAVGQAIKNSALQANGASFTHAFRLSALFEIVLLAIVFSISFILPKHMSTKAFKESAL
jgi:EmrB/QacA subfamily drug resistance transporter